jgi:hypothetical protein
MSRPKLNLDDLKVESFTTGFGLSAQDAGTVNAYITFGCPYTELQYTCDPINSTCGEDFTCAILCADTRGSICPTAYECTSTPDVGCTGFNPCTDGLGEHTCDQTCMNVGTCQLGTYEPCCGG